jgi:hypothetical protein
MLGVLVDGFSRYSEGGCSLEKVHDHLRHNLDQHSHRNSSWGVNVSVNTLLDTLLQIENPILSSHLFCPQHHPVSKQYQATNNCHIDIGRIDPESIQNELDLFCFKVYGLR